jgi:hypothetical protein
MVMMPPPPQNPRFLRVTVRNIGTDPTTLTNLSLHTYGAWWARFKNRPTLTGVLNHYQGPQIPYKLEVGMEWCALMEQDERLADWPHADGL